MNKHHHFMIFSLPAQGHINPTLQLAKNLARAGARVTFATTTVGLSRMRNRPTVDGLFFESFTDGNDGGGDTSSKTTTPDDYMAKFKQAGPGNLARLLDTCSSQGHPVTFLVYTIMLPWVADVARAVHVPSAFLVIQCTAALAIYHHFFNANNGVHKDGVIDINDPSFSLKLPGLPLLSHKEIPSFLIPSDHLNSLMTGTLRDHMEVLEKDPNPLVLINTFEALEEKQLKSFPNMNIIPIGPLVPSAFSDGNDATDTSFGCDMFGKSTDYLSWLDSKAERSVVYVSFGSLAEISREQKEEVLEALMGTSRPFLWVIRSWESESEEAKAMKDKGVEERGLVVPWCTQTEVLFHKSIGCFLTHCGWNSTLESLVASMPIVACPHFSDQFTNAKLVEEVWGTGLWARANEKKVVEREEIKRCLEIVMGGGERGEEIRKNANKWASLAVEAMKEGGSSNRNLKKFLEDI
nr:crocetin glucosyltransferase, chloroplastic-like [Ipomoea batatas]